MAQVCEQLAPSELVVKQLREALEYVIKCFDAAQFEGLAVVLSETRDKRLKDLVERRLMVAAATARSALSVQPGITTSLDTYMAEALAERDAEIEALKRISKENLEEFANTLASAREANERLREALEYYVDREPPQAVGANSSVGRAALSPQPALDRLGTCVEATSDEPYHCAEGPRKEPK